MIPFEALSKLLGLGTATGVRAGFSLFCLAFLAHFDWVALPPTFAWMKSYAALGALLALALLEAGAERDDDIQQIMEHAQFGLRGLSGGIASMAASTAGLQQPSDMHYVIAGALGAAIAVLTHGLRMRLHHALYQVESEAFSPRKWVNRLENGGVVAIALAALLAPAIALGAVIASLLAFALGAVVAKRFEARWRRPCPACAQPIRMEASRCPKCRESVPIVLMKDLRLLGGIQDSAKGFARKVTA